MSLASVIIVMTILCLSDLSVDFIRNHWAKKCNYDCSKCKVWDCRFHICNEKRRKLNEKF